MSKRDDILAAAESAFESHGFHAVPVDDVIKGAAVSPRTLYTHFPSKTDLAVAVLEARHERFLSRMRNAAEGNGAIPALFDALEAWLTGTPPNGCLFLRAQGEFGTEPITPVVDAYKSELRAIVARAVQNDGLPPDIVDPLFVLIEGATALAKTLGAGPAVDAARQAADALTSKRSGP